MAAAYAALVSLSHTVEQIQHHPSPPISLDKEQVESLVEKVNYLQDFLEGYSHHAESKEADGLESLIADAAYVAEGIIESHKMNQILARPTSNGGKFSSIDLYQILHKVIEAMNDIKKVAMEIKEKMQVQHLLHEDSSISAASLKSPFTDQNNTMVGFDDMLNEILDKLTGQPSNLRIIPIVGMGGIGKTTLARNIYTNQLIVQYFHILAWITISQEYSPRELLLRLLCQRNKWNMKDLENLCEKSEDELGEILYKDLSGMRYLIVIDDIWRIEAWDKVKFFFPNNNNGSRIMITTRLSNLAFQLCGSHGFLMSFLDDDQSWNLLCKNVFGEEGCPPGFEEIGKKIAKNCRGLPLLVTVIGGLLRKSRTQEYWQYTLENLHPVITLEEDNERCLQILYLSYKELPVHLKPCFLYMGIVPKKSEIRSSELIKLWVAEGFLKPVGGKSLEQVAEMYLKQLIDRNLILIDKWSSSGKIKLCKIHDLLRDLCLREVDKGKFLCVIKRQSLDISYDRIQRRFGIFPCKSVEESLSRVHFSLLRVYNMDNSFRDDGMFNLFFQANIFELINLRYLSYPLQYSLPSSVCHLWNLQTLIARHSSAIVPREIWKMPLLRHVEFKTLYLPDPPNGDTRDDFVLGNLQTLFRITIWDCREKVVERIPNIKKLKICQGELGGGSVYCLNNLGHLHKLESLCCSFQEKGIRSELLHNLNFPHSLQKLTLQGCRLHWEDMTAKIGSLPLLEVLKLKWRSFIGPEWETVEGQFCSLKFLLIEGCGHLNYWRTDSTHFPRLEHLRLRCLDKLKEIPQGIGEIATLRSIQLDFCSHSAGESAKRILDEQEELGNVGLQIGVVALEDYGAHQPVKQVLGELSYCGRIVWR